jgi:hypothetical protein
LHQHHGAPAPAPPRGRPGPAKARGCRTLPGDDELHAPRPYAALAYESRLEIAGFGPGIFKHFMVREAPPPAEA